MNYVKVWGYKMNYSEAIVISLNAKSHNNNHSNRIRDLKIDTSKYRENKSHIKKIIPLKL